MAFCSATGKLFYRNLMKYNFLKNDGVEDQFETKKKHSIPYPGKTSPQTAPPMPIAQCLLPDYKLLPSLLTYELHRPLSALGRGGKPATGKEPLAGHIEILQLRELHFE